MEGTVAEQSNDWKIRTQDFKASIKCMTVHFISATR